MGRGSPLGFLCPSYTPDLLLMEQAHRKRQWHRQKKLQKQHQKACSLLAQRQERGNLGGQKTLKHNHSTSVKHHRKHCGPDPTHTSPGTVGSLDFHPCESVGPQHSQRPMGSLDFHLHWPVMTPLSGDHVENWNSHPHPIGAPHLMSTDAGGESGLLPPLCTLTRPPHFPCQRRVREDQLKQKGHVTSRVSSHNKKCSGFN